MFVTPSIGGESRVRFDSGDAAEPPPLFVVADRDHKVAVRGGKRFVRNDRRMPVAHARRRRSRGEEDPGLIGEERRHGVEHADVDLLPPAAPFPGEERSGNALRANMPVCNVRDRHAEPATAGRCQPRSRDAHQTRLRPASPHRSRPRRCRGPVVAESRDRAVDEPRISGRQAVVVRRISWGSGPKIFDEHIGFREQLFEHRKTVRMLEVQRNAFLVAVDAREIGAFPFEKRGTPGPRIVALARLFDLQHPRAEVGGSIVQYGPDRTRVRSRTVMSWRGVIANLLYSPNGGVCPCLRAAFRTAHDDSSVFAKSGAYPRRRISHGSGRRGRRRAACTPRERRPSFSSAVSRSR